MNLSKKDDDNITDLIPEIIKGNDVNFTHTDMMFPTHCVSCFTNWQFLLHLKAYNCEDKKTKDIFSLLVELYNVGVGLLAELSEESAGLDENFLFAVKTRLAASF